MPDTNGFGGYPISTGSENANAQVAFGDFREAIAPHTVLFATSEANRNSLYGSGATSSSTVPDDTIVSCSTTQTVWQKSSTGWNTVYSDTGFLPLTGAGWKPDWEDNGSVYRILNGLCYTELRAVYSGVTISPTSTGAMTDAQIVTLPSAARPVRAGAFVPATLVYGANFGSAVLYNSSGNVTMTVGQPDNSLTAGTNVFWTATYFVA